MSNAPYSTPLGAIRKKCVRDFGCTAHPDAMRSRSSTSLLSLLLVLAFGLGAVGCDSVGLGGPADRFRF
jgi:hypothetical protein